MLGGLPIEIALEIFSQASEVFAVSDRASAVALAQTNRLVYTTVRPTLLRRVTVTKYNTEAVDNLLQQTGSAALVLDLNITTGGWDPGPIVCNLVNLRCIRGIVQIVDYIIPKLPASARASLYKIQLWVTRVGPVPPSVTHICLYVIGPNVSALPGIIRSVKSTPSLTHLGCEFVARGDNEGAFFLPDWLVTCLHAIFEAGGLRLRQIADRLCGSIIATDALWNTYLAALRAVEEEAPSAGWGQRVHLWRDTRCFDDSVEDVEASIADGMVGIDVWSEARSLQELLAEVAVERVTW